MTPLSLLLLPSNAAAALLPASRVAGGATSAAFANGFGTTCATDELRRPPRGWNSYDSSPPWGPPPLGMEASREGPTLKNAATLSRTLLPHGYDMFTLDSGWFGEDNLYGTQTIDEYGRLVPNVTQFPSAANGAGFRPVADKIHQHGLKFGIWIGGGIPRMAVEARSPIKGSSYTAADIAIVDGPKNSDGYATGSMDCPWNKWLLHGINHSHPGAAAYIDSLAELYADSWKLDMLKIDCVFGNDWFRGKEFVSALIKALQTKGRPFLISLSPGGQINATLAAAARDTAAKFKQPLMARLTGDFWDNWAELKGHFQYAANLANYSTPYFSPDLDMLPMGWIAHVGTGPRFSMLTEQEQRSMMTMWVMSRAPLIWGGDPQLSNASTLALLNKQKVLDVQTSSCRNQLVASVSTNESVIWAAQGVSADDARVVAMFNLADSATALSMPWSAIGLSVAPSATTVEELWERPNLISVDRSALKATLMPHDAVLVSIGRLADVDRTLDKN